jgi:hypothetical protein
MLVLLRSCQVHLSKIADLTGEKLAYFNDLEKVTKVFNAPGEESCLNEFFCPMLTRLDECMAFVEANVR